MGKLGSSTRGVALLLAAVFSLTVAFPPTGVVTHRHAGDHTGHVHVGDPWRAADGFLQAGGDEIPFASNDTKVDWWADARPPHGQGHRWHRDRGVVGLHVHAFSPLPPAVPGIVFLLPELTGAISSDAVGGAWPENSAAPPWHSRAPPGLGI